MEALTFEQARERVLACVRAAAPAPPSETVPLTEAAGRILARDIFADRDHPVLPRSVRDGFALRSADVPGRLRVVGEIRAGAIREEPVSPGEAVEIMTGAPMPPGADAVAMVEHVQREGDWVIVDRPAPPGEFVDPPGSMCRAGARVLEAGRRIDYPAIAMLAAAGCARVPVFRKPEVAIIATGDELVDIHTQPAPHQIRNSNAYSLAAQVLLSGGVPRLLPVAPDDLAATRALIEEGLRSDLLLLSGGVSAGKYDVVERALLDLGAAIEFERVKIQPGQPLVFGRCRGAFFFGLPGNPASTMVCFEIFARAALELLAGHHHPCLPLLFAELTAPVQVRPGLTRFLPASLDDNGRITPVRWQGSGDIPAVARANCFLVTEPARTHYAAGEQIRVLLR